MQTNFSEDMQADDQTLMSITMGLAQVSRAYKAAADRVVADFGLSQASAWPVIMIDLLGDGVRPGTVADALGLEPSSLVRVIDQLVEAGLVERHEDASDRRARTLHLTNEGRRRAVQLTQALAAFRRALFSDIAREDIAACTRVLQGLGAAINAHGQEQ